MHLISGQVSQPSLIMSIMASDVGNEATRRTNVGRIIDQPGNLISSLKLKEVEVETTYATDTSS